MTRISLAIPAGLIADAVVSLMVVTLLYRILPLLSKK